MLYFLHGLDIYRLQKKLEEIQEKFMLANKTGLNFVKFDILQISFKDFWDAFCQQSIFVQKKLFFLENFFGNNIFKQDLKEKVGEIAKSQNIVVLIERKEVKNTDKFFLVLKKHATCQEFPNLTGVKLKNWVKKEFSAFGIVIEPAALDALLEKAGHDSWGMHNEIQKLVAYKYFDKVVSLLDVKALLDSSVMQEAEIFKTIDALANGNKKKVLQLLDNHLKMGDDVFYLLSMIAFQFRNLLIAKSEGENNFFPDSYTASNVLARKFSWHPFVAKKSWELANHFSLEGLRKIYQKILLTDLKIKTGQIGPSDGLRMLVAEI